MSASFRGPKNSWFWLSAYVAVVSGALLVSDIAPNLQVLYKPSQPNVVASNPTAPTVNSEPTALVPATPSAPSQPSLPAPAPANVTLPAPNLTPATPPTASVPAPATQAPAAPNTAPAASAPQPAAAAAAPAVQPGQPFTAGNGMEMNWVKPMNGWVGKYLVTQAEYQAVMGNNPSYFKGHPRRPVEMVSWNDAMAYCQKLTDLDHASGKLPVGSKYTLPSDAQYDIFVGDASLNDAVTSQGTSRSEDTDVGTKAPNEYGLYDTRGEVWEWCLDWYDQSIYEKDSWRGKTTDLIGEKYKVLRGGSWDYYNPEDLAVSCRGNGAADFRDYADGGFRVVVVFAP